MSGYKSRIATQRKSLKLITMSTAAIAAALTAVPANAQTSGEGFEDEIIVTARRKSESIKDVPGTVTAITGDVLAKAGVSRAQDFIGLTPGVTLVDAADAGDTQVNIRGINGARDAENSFAFIIDGVLYTNPAAFNREYTNLQQIEVFKGPQGAIYGRNAAAGAIIVTTEKPNETTSGSLTFSGAQDNTYLAKGGISGQIADDLFIGLSIDYRASDGFYRNSFRDNSANVDAFESFNINGRLVYEPNDQLSFDFKARQGTIDANAIVFNANFHLPVFAAATSTPGADLDVNDHPFEFQNNVISDNDQDAFELSGKVDYDLGSTTLTAWALYSDIENNLLADGTSAAFGFFNNDPACRQTVADFNAQGFVLPSPTFFGQVPDGVIFNPAGSFLGAYTPSTCDGVQEQLRDQSDLSGEIRLASNDSGPLSWTVGAYALDIDRQVGVSTNRDGGQGVRRGLLQLDGENRTIAIAYDDFDSSVLAAFGSLDYAVSDRLDASLALRYDIEKRKVSSLVPTDATQTFIDLDFNPNTADPLNAGLSPLFNTTGTLPDKEETFKQIQPKASLTYDVSDDITLFGSWGVGFKAGGFNNSGSAATIGIFNNGLISSMPGLGLGINFADDLGSALPVITDDYDKETSSAFELGFKTSLFDNRLKLNGAGYYTDVTDMQFFEFFVGGFGLLRVVSNIDEVEIMGAELGAELSVTDNINLYAGGNITESEIKANSSRTDTVGNKSPYTPDYTFNVGGDVGFDVSNGTEFVVRADAQFIGPTWFHTVQGGARATIFNPLFEAGFGPGAGALGTADFANARRDAYMTVGLRAGLQNENWSLTAFAQNVTNESYLEEVIPAPEFGGSFLAPGAQRRFGVEASYKF